MLKVSKKKSALTGVVFLVHGTDKDKPIWHYVLVDRPKLASFKHTLKKSSIDVAQYGKVLYSGWGENPPPEIARAVSEQFD